MRSSRTLITFLLALSGFLAVGVGVLLIAPHGGSARAGAPAHASPAAAAAAASATPDTLPSGEVAATPAPGEYALLSDAPSIARPDEPSRIVIPSIKLDSKVVEVGIVMDKGKPAWDTAAFAVGFHRGSALPGTPGNTVMNGHISSPVSHKGDVFRHLPEVRIGDEIDVYVGDKKVAYDVTELRVVPPTAIDVLKPTPDATLTLITCYPDNVYTSRLIVIGKLAGAAT
jgi:sortase A